MLIGLPGEKRRAYAAGRAVTDARTATDELQAAEKSGRRRSWKARIISLSSAERGEIARMSAKARWKK